MDPANFFEPSFLSAIEKNTEESFRDIIIEPFPGILTFAMLQPGFCKKLVDEVLSSFCSVLWPDIYVSFLPLVLIFNQATDKAKKKKRIVAWL